MREFRNGIDQHGKKNGGFLRYDKDIQVFRGDACELGSMLDFIDFEDSILMAQLCVDLSRSVYDGFDHDMRSVSSTVTEVSRPLQFFS